MPLTMLGCLDAPPPLNLPIDVGIEESDAWESGPGAPAEQGRGDAASVPNASPQASFESTFEGLRSLLFEGQGCVEGACHGEAAAGGLDLGAPDLHSQLVEADSQGSTFARIEPGDRMRSYLFLKLLAAREPDAPQIAGSPMPPGGTLIPQELFDALRLWIYAGAPEEGSVPGTAELLGVDLPEPRPISITPLAPPAPDEGFQIALPPWTLPAASEREICFATYFDVRHLVPAEAMDAAAEFVHIGAEEIRQDPQSHHLSLNMSGVPLEDIHHPAFGEWRCAGGAREGELCEPTDLASCANGTCIAAPQDSFACIGYGPAYEGGTGLLTPIGVAQSAHNHQVLLEGVYRAVPLRGIAYWNSHAFNLSEQDHVMKGRLNLTFAPEALYEVQDLRNLVSGAIFLPATPPFEREEVCATVTLPQGAHLFSLSSHTHQRGERFTVTHPDGTLLYENTIFNDPLRQHFDPPLIFESASEEERTLSYCGLYNNGVGPEGAPDPETVTRHSRMPDLANASGMSGGCEPVACVSGQVGAPCQGVGDDAVCDSAPGAGDGWCDACAITGGQSTENEMFVLLGDYYLSAE